MRPPIDEEAIDMLLADLPSFEDHYLDLLDLYGEDLTPEIIFMELADVVSNLPASGHDEDEAEIFRAVENVAREAPDGRFLVTYPFLATLSVARKFACRACFGPITAALADALEAGDPG
jgi:hypothetical protein